MKRFLDKDFILETPTAKKLFHKFAEKMPIFDFHNHLSAKEIYENQTLGNLANAWLDHDHYKWRAMRAFGVSEELITGHLNLDGSVNDLGIDHDYKRFYAFVKTLQNCI
jgi:glucuronate isomerase